MDCQLKPTPEVTREDIPAILERYAHERDRRLRKDGQKQYIEVDDFNASHEEDPHMPVEPRAPISEDLDVAILGAGFTGILAGVHLKKAGVTNVRNIDATGSFGGVWYWNRYPGVQCDNDAYCYMPLLEETGYIPSAKFANGYEIHDHCQRIADHFGLREKALFHTVIESLKWDASIARWHVKTNRGDDIRARFVIMAGGPVNRPKLPGIPGIDSFKGKMFHTARWEYDYTGGSWRNPVLDKLGDKKVALLGTGASAVQAIPFLGDYAKQVYVIQRTPSTVDERNNTPTDPEWVKTLKPGWQAERQANFHRGAMERFLPGEKDLICDIWTELSRNVAAELEARGWPEVDIMEYFMMRDLQDFRVMERLRKRVDDTVLDKATAEALKPWYRYLCKRPCSNDDYYPTFNKPNVKLIDVSETRGLERMTEKGFVHQGVEYEIDCIMFASGFEVTSDLDRRWGIGAIEGRDGLSLYDWWADGFRTLHGMSTHGFPGMFFTGYVQGGLNSSTTEQFGKQGEHIAWVIAEALKRGADSVEPTMEAQDAYVDHLRSVAIDIKEWAQQCTPSYFNNEGSDKFRFYLGESYGPGWDAFQNLLKDWRDSGDLPGMTLIKA